MGEQLHLIFHEEYGFGNNTNEQFKEFITRLEKGDFSDFLEENNLELNINKKLIRTIIERRDV